MTTGRRSFWSPSKSKGGVAPGEGGLAVKRCITRRRATATESVTTATTPPVDFVRPLLTHHADGVPCFIVKNEARHSQLGRGRIASPTPDRRYVPHAFTHRSVVSITVASAFR